VAAENSSTGSRIVVFGDAEFASDLNFFQQRNGDMLINSIDWATEQEELINLTPRQQTTRSLVPPSQFYINMIILMSACVLPGVVLAIGISVWVSRRRRM
jgi:ABC-type uncharacterized transport system involved in gliding motility auxiliary subunit